MNLHVRPTLSAMLREGAGPLLVALQVAITLAVLVNAVFVVGQRVAKINRPTGMDIENIFAVRSVGFTENYRHESVVRADLQYLRTLPDVVAVTSMDYVPFSGHGNRLRATVNEDDDLHQAPQAAMYEVDEHGLEALGVGIVAGRNFRGEDIFPPRMGEAATSAVPQVLITQALAEDLFPKTQAVGKGIYTDGGYTTRPAIITGVIENMHHGRLTANTLDRVILMPRLPYPAEPAAHYVVRARPGRLAEVMRTVEQHFAAPDPDRFIDWIKPLDFFRQRTYAADRNMAVFLVAVTALLLVIASLGAFGLAMFNVSTRTKQIGTRRAVGARRIDIIAQFMVENWLVTTAGVLGGCALALAAGSWLASEYGLPRLDLYYLVGGVPVLWILGMLAAWYPARRAAAVSPATATRAV